MAVMTIATLSYSQQVRFIQQGMYKVGSDLPQGEYIIQAEPKADGYYQITKDSSGSITSILTNDIIPADTFAYLIVKDGDYLLFRDSRIVSSKNANLTVRDTKKIFAGMYKVGIDIPEGEYKLNPSSDGYWERTKDPRRGVLGIIANDLFTSPVYVTVKKGEYLKFRNATAELIK
jgi:hypothetical protein